MKKKTVNTIMVVDNFFQAAAFIFKKGNFYQQAFADAFVDPVQKETSSKIIKSACQEKKIGFRNNFLTLIPRSQVTIKSFELPSTSANEIKQMVNFQLQNSLPYRLENLIIQNLMYPSSKEGYLQVKTVVVQKELIENLIEIFKLSTIKVSRIDLSSVVLINRFKMVYKREAFFKETSLLIDIEGEGIDFVFIRNGQILLSRGVLLNKDNFKEDFLREIKKSLSLFSHKFQDKLLLILLWGRRPDLSNLADLISGHTDLEVQVKESENLLKSLAYSTYEEKEKINLLPDLVREKQRHNLKRKNFLRIILFIAVIFIFLITGLFFDFKEKQKQLTDINYQIEQIKSDAVEIQQKKLIIESALMNQAKTLQSLEILGELYSITAPGIFFSSFSLTPAESAIIKGQAEELDKILEFVSKLESSSLFENVELKYTSKRRLKEKEIIDFEIAFFISRPQFNISP